MKTKELIKVFIRIENGHTKCICTAENKRCPRKCDKGEVTRDKFAQWESTMKRNRYGV